MLDDIRSLGRFRGLKAASLSAAQSAVLQRLTSDRGSVPAPYRYLIASPVVVEHVAGLGTQLRQSGELTDRELEIVVLVTARHFRTEFVEAAHRRISRKVGLPDSVIDAILSEVAPTFSDAREARVYELAKALHENPVLSERAAAEAEQSLGAKMIAEVIAVIGLYTVTCYTMRFVAASASEVGAGG
jgi:4-carboxymuconolactone decarboxylase